MIKRFILLLLLVFLVVPKDFSYAQQSTGSATVTPVPTEIPYQLPYPGLLPDNPLYFFKVLRDNVMIFFVTNPQKKAEYYLLQSDKRVQAAFYLLAKKQNNTTLVVTTLSKSNNYLQLAVAQVKSLKDSGQDAGPLVDRLNKAIAKHRAVVNQMIGQNGMTQLLESEAIRLSDMAKVVTDFSTKK